ncbi:hypothetical protein Tco_1265786 [Tanacetum coccineum]
MAIVQTRTFDLVLYNLALIPICNTPKSGLQQNVEYPRALLHRSIAQDMRTTTKRVIFKKIHWEVMAAPQLETHAHPPMAHAPRPKELAVSVYPLGLISPHRLPRRFCRAQSRCRRKCR